MLETKREVPLQWIEPKPLKEIKDKKIAQHYLTSWMRKKYILNYANLLHDHQKIR